jgi:hypothetical protein
VSNMTRKKRILTSGVAILVLAVVGLVYAAWTTSGSGSGYAEAGNALDLTTSEVSTTTVGKLYPGGTGDVKIKINNPNPYPVKVTDVTQKTGTAGTITADNNCTPTGVSFADQSGKSILVPAKAGGVDGSVTETFTNAAKMSNASDDACQGAVFTIPVDLKGSSNATP